MKITTSNAYTIKAGDKMYRMGNTSNAQKLHMTEYTAQAEAQNVNGKMAIPAQVKSITVVIDENLLNSGTLYTTIAEVEAEYAEAF